MNHKRTRNQVEQERRWTNYEDYIKDQGFTIFSITGDGNCLFRAVSHQLEGYQENHRFYRDAAVKYMTIHKRLAISSLMMTDIMAY